MGCGGDPKIASYYTFYWFGCNVSISNSMKPTNIQRSILHELLYDVFQMFQMFQMFVYLNFPEFPAKYLFSIYTRSNAVV